MTTDERISAFRAAEQAYLGSLGIHGRERLVRLERLGITGRYQEIGDGPPVLMVHGGGGLGSGWAALMPRLPDFRLIVPDRPGFGLTEFADYGGVDLRAHAVSFLLDVLDDAQVEKVSIVANSMGALWSLWLTEAHPERVARLALLGTPALILETSAPAGMRLLGVPGLGRLMTAIEPPSPKQVRAIWTRMGHDPDATLTPESIELIVRLQQLPWYRDAWLSLLRNVVPWARKHPRLGFGAAQLEKLTQEVLYIWGERDPFGSLDVARRAHAATPGSRLEIVGVGHLPWLDDPETCGRLVRAFLAEQEDGAAPARA